jgi:hypothetical protein
MHWFKKGLLRLNLPYNNIVMVSDFCFKNQYNWSNLQFVALGQALKFPKFHWQIFQFVAIGQSKCLEL